MKTTTKTLTGLLIFLLCSFASRAEDVLQTASTNTAFQVRNRKFGDLLRPRDASNRDGTRIVLYPAQPWKCMIWRFTNSGENSFRLKNQFTSKSFAAATNTPPEKPSPVIQVPCAADTHHAPAWNFTKSPDGSYRIVQPGSNLALTATDSEGGEVRVVLSPWRDADEQKWELLKAPEHPTM
jgi:hypothetical protein